MQIADPGLVSPLAGSLARPKRLAVADLCGGTFQLDMGTHGICCRSRRCINVMAVPVAAPPLQPFSTSSSSTSGSRETQGADKKSVLLKQLKESGSVAAAEELRSLKLLGNLKDYTMVIAGLARSGKWQLAVLLLREAQGSHLRPDTIVYNAAINACSKAQAPPAVALELLGQLLTENLEPSAATWSSSVLAVGLSDSEQGQQHHQQQQQRSRDDNGRSWWQNCAHGWTGALELLSQAKGYGLRPDVVTFSATVSACARGHRWEHVLEILSEMRHAQAAPNALTVTNALGSLVSNWKVALELVMGASAGRVTPDVVCFGSALSAFEKCKAWEQVLAMLPVMRRRAVPPNVVTWNSAASACEKAGQWRRALQVFATLRSGRDGLEPTVITLNAVVSACEKAARWAEALALLGLALGHPSFPAPSTVTFNAAISACEKAAQGLSARQLLHEMTSSASSWQAVPLPNVVTFNAAISACEKSGDWEWALQLLQSLLGYGGPGGVALEPDCCSFGATASALSRGSFWAGCLQLLQACRLRSVPPDGFICNSVLSACHRAQQPDRSWRLLEEMMTRGPSPDLVAFNSAIAACEALGPSALGLGRWQQALKLLAQLRAARLRPDAQSYNGALNACGGAGQWRTALLLVRELCRDGLRPDLLSYAALVRACEKATRWQIAVQLVDSLDVALKDALLLSSALRACERSMQSLQGYKLLQALDRLGVAAASGIPVG
ncbi:unnamed protein product [Polarella glacialis]|uniref:Pentatricopeptide repeat-containing protein, chloroplastic n=1 Tax=Polarella glacialis TaxID=89957 RepID=A0A813FX33_POLGL|nr:unnamed protein product [Polarella glacialis]